MEPDDHPQDAQPKDAQPKDAQRKDTSKDVEPTEAQPKEEPKAAVADAADEVEQSLPPPKIEPPYKFKLSQSQKRRSKLDQQQDPVAPTAAQEAPATTPAPAPAVEPASLRRTRFKRSGHMHEDLNAPRPDQPAKPEDTY